MTESVLSSTDQDALFAAVDLVGRTGATNCEIGYLHDHVPSEQAGWYAHAQFRGARVTEEDHPGPVEAAEALARRLLVGGRCTCGKLVALADGGAMAFPGRMADGSVWTEEQIRAAGQCRWWRSGRHWLGACGAGLARVPV